ncbi:MAG: asparaginase domain-containing protein [Pseudomonadota bacterium]
MPQKITRAALRLIYAGGTIGSAGSPLSPLPAREFRARWEASAAPALAADGTVLPPLDWQSIEPPLDSSDMGPAEWLELATTVIDAAAEGAHGVVLLHGTDTLASTAAALAYLTTMIDPVRAAPVARLGCPVVVTGSQRPLFDGGDLAAGTDALSNAAAAIASASDGGSGIRVAFARNLLPAARVAKRHTAADDAFWCPNGEADPAPLPAVEPADLRETLTMLSPHLGKRAVAVIQPAPEAPAHTAALIEAAIAGPAADNILGGVILAGFGEGNLPARAAVRLKPLFDELRQGGVPIVIASQVPAGPAGGAGYATGHWLAEVGAIPAGTMTLAALHAKLHLGSALASLHGWSLAHLERFLTTDIAGETL